MLCAVTLCPMLFEYDVSRFQEFSIWWQQVQPKPQTHLSSWFRTSQNPAKGSRSPEGQLYTPRSLGQRGKNPEKRRSEGFSLEKHS